MAALKPEDRLARDDDVRELRTFCRPGRETVALAASVLDPDAIVRLNLGRLYLPGLKIQIPVHGFLIKHPKGAGLIDTGYGTNLELIKDFRPVNASIAEALRLHGVEPSDIRWVINSHLHFDHCAFQRSLEKLQEVRPATVHFCHDKRTWHQPRVQV